MKLDIIDALGLVGFAAVVTGLALLSVPVALITAGVFLLAGSIWRDLAATRRRR